MNERRMTKADFLQRGEFVASHLFGKPPNPRRGTSWKRRQTSPLHIPSYRWLPSKEECSDGKLKEKTNEREVNDEGGLPLKGECNEGKGN